MSELKRTPIHSEHVAAGAKLVPFAGFEMPVSYSGIIEEHEAVRERAGVFDVSHMGEFIVTGADTWQFVDSIVTNNCAALADDGVLYTVMCREDGTVVDDLLVTRLGPEKALIVVNAANIEKDLAHVNAHLNGDVAVENASDRYALIAVQGPRSREVLKRCPFFAGAGASLDSVAYYRYFLTAVDGTEVIVSRTGYTGELGFEIFLPPELAAPVWRELLEHGAPHGLVPVGLAARDTLRFEASFCLYGHELDDDTTPMEAGLNWVVKLKKGPFAGRDALAAQKKDGPPKKLIGLELDGRNIARQGFPILRDGTAVGKVTSGSFSPTLKKSLCLAYVAPDGGEGYAVEVRGKPVAATAVELPFYRGRARDA